LEFAGGSEDKYENLSFKVVFPAEFRTGHLPNTNQKGCYYSQFIQPGVGKQWKKQGMK
jgi:hypothetical protein